MHYPKDQLQAHSAIESTMAALILILVVVRYIHLYTVPASASKIIGNISIGLAAFMIVLWAIYTNANRVSYTEEDNDNTQDMQEESLGILACHGSDYNMTKCYEVRKREPV